MLVAIEPALEGVPPGMIRRMSKAVRMGLGAGLPLLAGKQPDGIILGTANGGMEDCIKFLNQIIDYDEGMLTPGNFVQSTPNAIAGQLSLIKKNHQYNATHVHLGLAFENALIDALLFLKENTRQTFLVGGVDEISTYNYNIDRLAGWYDPELTSENLYSANHAGTIAGEGAAMFLLSGNKEGALAKIETVETLHTTDPEKLKTRLSTLLDRYPMGEGTIFISGENGDRRSSHFYGSCEALTGSTPVVRYKNITGEYPTASSFATWLAAYALESQNLPANLFKRGAAPKEINRAILYNNYHGHQHSFIVVSRN